MKDIKVSIDRIVIDFTHVHWNFFNQLHKRISHFYGVNMTVKDKGLKYHIKINTGEHFMHISYQLVFAKKSHKNTLRIEVYPKSLGYFISWLEQFRLYAKEVLFVRCDVAYDIPMKMKEVFTMSKTGRKLRPYKETRYYNGTQQRQEDGYCRVYDKKRQLWERKKQKLKEERTRMEIVYAPWSNICYEKGRNRRANSYGLLFEIIFWSG